jgi:hypothetical protein
VQHESVSMTCTIEVIDAHSSTAAGGDCGRRHLSLQHAGEQAERQPRRRAEN